MCVQSPILEIYKQVIKQSKDSVRKRIDCSNDSFAGASELESLMIYQGGSTCFGPALRMAHVLLTQGLQQQPEYSPLLMFMSDGGASDGEAEMRILCTELSKTTAELQVKTLAFGPGASGEKLRDMANLGGGEFLTAIDGVELKEVFQKTAASLVVKTHCR